MAEFNRAPAYTCEVCGEKKDCRRNIHSRVIFCREKHGDDSGRFVYLGEAHDGLWGMYLREEDLDRPRFYRPDYAGRPNEDENGKPRTPPPNHFAHIRAQAKLNVGQASEDFLASLSLPFNALGCLPWKHVWD